MKTLDKCTCCEYLTIDSLCAICPVCFWQKDSVQEENTNDAGGPNLISLTEAKKNFHTFRAVEKRFVEFVRPPLEHEIDQSL